MSHHGHKESLLGKPVTATPVTEVQTPEQLILESMSAFGGLILRNIYRILDTAIGNSVPLIIPISGPLTVSNGHRGWAIPMAEAGWVAYFTTTDAVCYHDGHDSLQAFNERPIREVPIEGRDIELRDQGIIRVTNTGFDGDILYSQDDLVTTMLLQPEFQHRMTGTEFRYRMGRYYDAQERKYGVKSGFLATCWKLGIPVLCGAPGDGSVFLNHVKLYALKLTGMLPDYNFDLDVGAEVLESCAYHYWGLRDSPAHQLAVWILGGGVPKNFSLQPEPALLQIFKLANIRGYDYDVQIVGSPVTYGDLTGCKPEEAVTWEKVNPEAIGERTESLQADYTTLVPLIVWALLDKRQRFMELREKIGPEKLYERHPEARGYIREEGQMRLYERREALVARLLRDIKKPRQLAKLMKTTRFPLALVEEQAG